MVSLRTTEFDPYFRAQYPKLVSELDYLLGSTDLARDIAQEAFARQCMSWARLSRYDKPGAWVRRVALRIAFKTRRKLSRETPLDAAAAHITEESGSERRLDVRNAILQLTDRQRAAVVLHYYRDLPISEVAKIMRCKESTVKAHLFQARSHLATLLIAYKP